MPGKEPRRRGYMELRAGLADAWGRSCHERTIMDLKFENFRAEHVETLAGYYGKRHDRTCDSTIMDNFLWGGYYHIRFCERDGKAVLWIMNIDGKDYAALPVCGLEDLPHYFKEPGAVF